jgi:hypothetical protein
MTEEYIREIAMRFGLSVLKRVTAGDNRQHFATFELSGPQQNVVDAWQPLADLKRPGCDELTTVSNPEHPDHKRLYIRLESVWCRKGDNQDGTPANHS